MRSALAAQAIEGKCEVNLQLKVLGMGALALALSAGVPGLTIMAHAQQQ